MKKLIQIILLLVVVGLGYILYTQIMTPLNFEKEMNERKAAVVERIKDIRTAQRAFKQRNQGYAANFEELIEFLMTDSLSYQKTIGSADDSVAVAKGLVRVEEYKVAAKDTVFGAKKLSVEQIQDFANIPYGNGTKFLMDASSLITESQVIVPVFECRAPYKDFLSDLDNQELINLIDECDNVYMSYPGVKVGDLMKPTNDAGNWE